MSKRAYDKHLVLDLDECLVRSFLDPADRDILSHIMTDPALSHLRSRVFIVTESNDYYYWGIKRPHLDEFLEYVLGHFNTVSVWSAGTPSYVAGVVSAIFRNTLPPFITMTSDHILREKDRRYSKPLSKFYEMHNRRVDELLSSGSNRTEICHATPETTLFVDNRHENFLYDPGNGVHIPDYEPDCDIHALSMEGDDNLAKFVNFIDTSTVMDMRREDIFKPTHTYNKGTRRCNLFRKHRSRVYTN